MANDEWEISFDPSEPEIEENKFDNKAVVLVGNIAEGYRIFGPFDDFDSAAEWADSITDLTWIATLEDPP